VREELNDNPHHVKMFVFNKSWLDITEFNSSLCVCILLTVLCLYAFNMVRLTRNWMIQTILFHQFNTAGWVTYCLWNFEVTYSVSSAMSKHYSLNIDFITQSANMIAAELSNCSTNL